MGRYSGILLCSDIDGTFTDRQGKVSSKNAEAVEYFKNEGGLFTFATGRHPSFIKNLGIVPNTYIIGINGTGLYNPDTLENIYSTGMGIEAKKILGEIVESPYFERLEVHTEEPFFEDKRGIKSNIVSFMDEFPFPWKCVTFVQSEKHTVDFCDYLNAVYGNKFKFVISWPQGVEMYSKDSGKGVYLRELKKRTGSHTAVAAGDFGNDREMLIEADIGYAVANAHESVKTAADRITVSNDESAIAAIINEL